MVTDTTDSGQHWTGEAAITPGIGVFRGRAGDNRPHRHWAHQISVGLEGKVAFEIDGQCVSAPAVLIPAGIRHCQHAAISLSLYIDPVNTAPLPSIFSEAGAHWAVLSESEVHAILRCFPDRKPLQEALEDFAFQTPRSSRNRRLESVISAIQKCLREGREVNRNELAELCQLSPSRFSHWFSEQTGLPLRSYQKWLRLISALGIAVTSKNLSHAAVEAGFSDQAHFTRAVSEAFGISPTHILRLLS